MRVLASQLLSMPQFLRADPGNERARPAAATVSAPASSAPPATEIGALYREHFTFVWRSLRRLGVHESSIDDAVQDVFLVAHRKLGEFEGRSSHRSWLFAIALRVAREHRRMDNRLELEESSSATSSAPCPDEELERRRRVQLLDSLLATLSDSQREVFVMSEVEGFSAPEIAEALGVAVNTVYSRLRLGRQRFERALAQRRHQREGAR